MTHNDDGTYTVTVNNETQVFPDCVTAAEWADTMRFGEHQPPERERISQQNSGRGGNAGRAVSQGRVRGGGV